MTLKASECPAEAPRGFFWSMGRGGSDLPAGGVLVT